jgi:hypothetical protein
MARIIPDGWEHLDQVAQSVVRELETLRSLASGLPDTYTVYHGIHWSTLSQGHAIFGEKQNYYEITATVPETEQLDWWLQGFRPRVTILARIPVTK